MSCVGLRSKPNLEWKQGLFSIASHWCGSIIYWCVSWSCCMCSSRASRQDIPMLWSVRQLSGGMPSQTCGSLEQNDLAVWSSYRFLNLSSGEKLRWWAAFPVRTNTHDKTMDLWASSAAAQDESFVHFINVYMVNLIQWSQDKRLIYLPLRWLMSWHILFILNLNYELQILYIWLMVAAITMCHFKMLLCYVRNCC